MQPKDKDTDSAMLDSPRTKQPVKPGPSPALAEENAAEKEHFHCFPPIGFDTPFDPHLALAHEGEDFTPASPPPAPPPPSSPHAAETPSTLAAKPGKIESSTTPRKEKRDRQHRESKWSRLSILGGKGATALGHYLENRRDTLHFVSDSYDPKKRGYSWLNVLHLH